MSYVVGGKTYDEGGAEIDAWGRRVGGNDANVAANQPLSAVAAKKGNGATIEDVRAPNYAAPATGAGGAAAAGNDWSPAPTNSASAGGGPATPTAASVDPRLNDLYSTLLQRAGQSLNVSPNDPAIKATTDAASVAGQRELLHSEQAMAERAGPYATGMLENNARVGTEALGNNMANLTATLMTNEIASRRSEIAQALSGQFGVLSLQDQDRLRQEDQALTLRQQNLTREQNQTQNGMQAQQQAWMQRFQEAGFSADQAARLWQEMFNQQQQDINQSNTVWDQNWKLSGGA